MNDFLTFMGFIFCLVRCVRCQVENIIRIHLDEKTKSSRYPTIATTIYNCSNLEDNNMMYYIRLLTASNLGWKGSFYTLAAMVSDYDNNFSSHDYHIMIATITIVAIIMIIDIINITVSVLIILFVISYVVFRFLCINFLRLFYDFLFSRYDDY